MPLLIRYGILMVNMHERLVNRRHTLNLLHVEELALRRIRLDSADRRTAIALDFDVVPLFELLLLLQVWL